MRCSFSSLNIGLAWMLFATLFPLGIRQIYESVNSGYFHARSLDYLTTNTNTVIEWLRLPGDIYFIADRRPAAALPHVSRRPLHGQERGGRGAGGHPLHRGDGAEGAGGGVMSGVAVESLLAAELRALPLRGGTWPGRAGEALAPALRGLQDAGFSCDSGAERLGVPEARTASPDRHRPAAAAPPATRRVRACANHPPARVSARIRTQGASFTRALDPWPHSRGPPLPPAGSPSPIRASASSVIGAGRCCVTAHAGLFAVLGAALFLSTSPVYTCSPTSAHHQSLPIADGEASGRRGSSSELFTARLMPLCVGLLGHGSPPPSVVPERRGWDSNPRGGLTRPLAFQASSLSHSDTSPGGAEG